MGLLNKFPSYEYLFKNAAATFKRFPLTLICAIIGTIQTVILIDNPSGPQEHLLVKIAIVCALGLPLFTAITIHGNKFKLTGSISYIMPVIGLLLLAVYYLSLPEDINSAYIYPIRFLLLNLCLHLLVSFIAFTGKNRMAEFWQFNKALFLRILLAALYSGALYIGLLIALASADHLFGMDIDPETYGQMWVIVIGIFNTWIFLAGIPEDLDHLNDRVEYPKGLKLFTQYILLPLVGLYFFILITYEAKIMITTNWPTNWVAQLVLWYAVVGILSLLLLHPLKNKEGNKWITVFSKYFFYALIPLIIMLYIAIFKRIADYGITENRYFVLMMAFGLTIVTIYFIFSKKKDIRIIPIVICILAFLSAYGPQSAFSISKSYQRNRLETLLTDNNLLVDGKLTRAEKPISFDDRKNISSIIKYFCDMHGANSLDYLLSDSLILQLDSTSRFSGARVITQMIGFEVVPDWKTKDSLNRVNFNAEPVRGTHISGYDYFYSFETGINVYYSKIVREGSIGNVESNSIPKFIYAFNTEEDSCYTKVDSANSTFSVRLGAETRPENTATIDLNEFIKRQTIVSETVTLPRDSMTFDISCDRFDSRIIFNNIEAQQEEGAFYINYLSGVLLMRLK